MGEPGKRDADGPGLSPVPTPSARRDAEVGDRAGGRHHSVRVPQGAVFTRTELKHREQDQMDQLADRMKIELGVLALRAVATTQGSNVGDAESAMVSTARFWRNCRRRRLSGAGHRPSEIVGEPARPRTMSCCEMVMS